MHLIKNIIKYIDYTKCKILYSIYDNKMKDIMFNGKDVNPLEYKKLREYYIKIVEKLSMYYKYFSNK